MNGPSAGMCSRPMRLRRKYRWQNGCSTAAGQPVDERVDAAPARTIEEGLAIHAFDTRHWWPRLQFADADRSRTDSTRSPRRSHRRGSVVGSGAARHARLRRRLLRRDAARQGGDPRPGVARRRLRAAPAQRRRVRRRLRERRPAAARSRPGRAAPPWRWSSTFDLADDRRRRSRAPRAQGLSRRSGATTAPSPRPPGATCSSASSWASSSAASTRPTTPASRPTSTSPPPTATATSSTRWARRRRSPRYPRPGPRRSSSAGRAPLL